MIEVNLLKSFARLKFRMRIILEEMVVVVVVTVKQIKRWGEHR